MSEETAIGVVEMALFDERDYGSDEGYDFRLAISRPFLEQLVTADNEVAFGLARVVVPVSDAMRAQSSLDMRPVSEAGVVVERGVGFVRFECASSGERYRTTLNFGIVSLISRCEPKSRMAMLDSVLDVWCNRSARQDALPLLISRMISDCALGAQHGDQTGENSLADVLREVCRRHGDIVADYIGESVVMSASECAYIGSLLRECQLEAVSTVAPTIGGRCRL